jgi:hypothetical protein
VVKHKLKEEHSATHMSTTSTTTKRKYDAPPAELIQSVQAPVIVAIGRGATDKGLRLYDAMDAKRYVEMFPIDEGHAHLFMVRFEGQVYISGMEWRSGTFTSSGEFAEASTLGASISRLMYAYATGIAKTEVEEGNTTPEEARGYIKRFIACDRDTIKFHVVLRFFTSLRGERERFIMNEITAYRVPLVAVTYRD